MIAALYAATEEVLPPLGFARYEVSNWARPGRESRHNLGYWLDQPYLGLGASAHAYYKGRRRACRLSAAAYIRAVDAGADTREDLDDGAPETRLAEALITALRLAEGADLDALGERYGVDLWRRHRGDLAELTRRGWAEVEPPRVRLTREGVLWSLDALAPFVGTASLE
jgi:oxygen-independent coproporphyrinogen-3 oxidase